MRLHLFIGRTIPSQNVRDRWHGFVRNRDKSIWLMLIRSEIARTHTPGRDVLAKGKRRLRIVSYRTQRITDRANLVGGCKGLVDAIVAAGLIVDDSDKWVDIEYAQELAGGNPRTELTIEDESC